jgi:hypothetical protein
MPGHFQIELELRERHHRIDQVLGEFPDVEGLLGPLPELHRQLGDRSPPLGHIESGQSALRVRPLKLTHQPSLQQQLVQPCRGDLLVPRLRLQ